MFLFFILCGFFSVSLNAANGAPFPDRPIRVIVASSAGTGADIFARIIGRPVLMRELSRVGLQSRTLMEWVLRIMANLLRPDEIGAAEVAYKAAAQIVRLFPNA